MNQLRNTVAETLEQLLERLADNKQVSDSDLDALSDDLRIARQDDGDRETLEAARELLSDIPSTNYAHGRLIEMRSEVLLKLQGLDRMQLLKKRFRESTSLHFHQPQETILVAFAQDPSEGLTSEEIRKASGYAASTISLCLVRLVGASYMKEVQNHGSYRYFITESGCKLAKRAVGLPG